jgi:drug/metabolite transporter (DMT)-like permease
MMRPGILLSLVYCGAAFGGAFLFMRLAAPELPAAVVAFGRIGIATALLLPLLGRTGIAAARSSWRHYVVVGFFMAAAPLALFAYAERSITAGLGSLINATTPLWTVLIMALWVRRAPTASRIAAVAIGFVGVGVIVGLEGLDLAPDAYLGVIAAVVAAASYGVALTYVRQRMTLEPPLQLVVGQLLAATIMLAPLAAVTMGEATLTAEAVVAMIGLSVFSTAIAWPILFRLNREVGPLATSTVTFLNPLFGVFWGAVFLAETVSPTFLAGAILVFIALGLIFEVRPIAAIRKAIGYGRPSLSPADADD